MSDTFSLLILCTLIIVSSLALVVVLAEVIVAMWIIDVGLVLGFGGCVVGFNVGGKLGWVFLNFDFRSCWVFVVVVEVLVLNFCDGGDLIFDGDLVVVVAVVFV